ncbi:MAG: hypothetical protein KIS67_20830 [Verrucomicrobiae bacterium]|nr:hypothetical protein [Verrucomicrobiae bacterium]
MKLRSKFLASNQNRAGGRRRSSGLSLTELIVATGLGMVVLMILGVLSVHALRSFVAMGNYASLDARNRLALDKMSRDIRQATEVTIFEPDGPVRRLKLTNALTGGTLDYTWYAEDRMLYCDTDGEPAVYLTECDDWSIAMYRRNPQPGATNWFFPTADKRLCKMVEMNWTCSRTLLGKKFQTESVQSARMVLRNKQ